MARITNVISILTAFGPLIVSLLLIVFASLDILHDIQNADGLDHILFETVVFFLGFLLNLYFVDKAARSISLLKQQNQHIVETLHSSVQENEKLKIEQQKFREGLTKEIERQLKNWGLSPSEVEISFLLLKGLSNKEIAEVRSTSESTVRLQCSSIYKKSNLSSRSELAAFFLEDMLFEPVKENAESVAY
jgi:DNA-binding CsgD family transcriptional regulator